MAYKPVDFFVGAVDIFAVLMPGAVFTAVSASLLTDDLLGIAVPTATNTVEFWVAFGVGSYLFGHLLFAAGSILDSVIYAPVRKKLIPPRSDLAYNAADRIKTNELGEHNAAMNTYQYCRSILDLNDPSAASQIRRLEADSKFFRSMAVIFALLFLKAFSCCAPKPQLCFLTTLLVASLGCYGFRRFKCAQLAYRFFVAKRMSEKSSNGKSVPGDDPNADE